MSDLVYSRSLTNGALSRSGSISGFTTPSHEPVSYFTFESNKFSHSDSTSHAVEFNMLNTRSPSLHLLLIKLFLYIFASRSTPVSLATDTFSIAPDSTTLTASDIPPDFHVSITWGSLNVHILQFYQNALAEIATETQYPFYSSSDGCWSRAYDFIVEPSRSTFPHLQHSHVVWAIQRVVEKVYETGRYKNLVGEIMVGGQSGEVVIVGRLTVKALPRPTTGEDALLDGDDAPVVPSISVRGPTMSDVDTAALLAGIEAPPLDQLTTSVSLDLGNTTQAVPVADHQRMYLAPYFPVIKEPEKPVKLHANGIFLTMVRALALIARKDTEEKVPSYQYADRQAGIVILFKAREGTEVQTKWGDLASSLPGLVSFMIGEKTWQECGGEFFREEKGAGGKVERVLYGRIHLMQLPKPKPGVEVTVN